MSGPEPIYVKCLTAGVAGSTADLVTFPLDVAKVRLQIQGERVNMTGRSLQRDFWDSAHYGEERGTSKYLQWTCPGLQRQMCFSSIRIGLYNPVKLFFAEKIGGSADSRTEYLHPDPRWDVDGVHRRDYRPAHGRGYRSQRGTYVDHQRRGVGLLRLREGIPHTQQDPERQCGVPLCFGVCGRFLRNRGGLAPRRGQDEDHELRAGYYKSMFHCAGSMYRESGVLAFYKGFMPSFVRLGAWNIVLFVTFEQLKRLVGQYYGNPTR
ncbi:UCP2 [Cordylochernes scorpioides]|uniref:UCP2 n=1 Tax=Cordylochernes scorpioides TaxID=51811 RepID=A0ABY6KEN3_9ARAC|nr:UCP2 [Cordylochernes scorpioides]